MEEDGLKYRLSRGLENIILRKANHIVVICQGLKDELLRRGFSNDKVSIIENGVDTDHFNPREKNQELVKKFGLDGKITIGFAGSFFYFEGIIGIG